MSLKLYHMDWFDKVGRFITKNNYFLLCCSSSTGAAAAAPPQSAAIIIVSSFTILIILLHESCCLLQRYYISYSVLFGNAYYPPYATRTLESSDHTVSFANNDV